MNYYVNFSFHLEMDAKPILLVLELDLPFHSSINGEIFVPAQLPFDENGMANVDHALQGWAGFSFKLCSIDFVSWSSSF